MTIDGHRMPRGSIPACWRMWQRARSVAPKAWVCTAPKVPFMINQRFPSEKEQLAIYREQLAAFHPQPVTMRSLDIGGDKLCWSTSRIKEDNPFLGCAGFA